MDWPNLQAACVVALTAAIFIISPGTSTMAHRSREVQTYLVIHHPAVKGAPGASVTPGGQLVGATSGGHQAAASTSSSYGYQLHSETTHHVPVLISTGHIPLLSRAPAHKTYVTVQHLHHAVHHHHQPLVLLPHPAPVHHRRRERLTAQGSSFRQKQNPYVRLPDYPAYPDRNAALSLEEDTLAEAEAEPSLKVYSADAEYPPLNMRNRRKLYSLGYIYMLDFLENSYLKR
ncbi:uncharacterized protein LOC144097133 [Amblyomma americanum]